MVPSVICDMGSLFTRMSFCANKQAVAVSAGGNSLPRAPIYRACASNIGGCEGGGGERKRRGKESAGEASKPGAADTKQDNAEGRLDL